MCAEGPWLLGLYHTAYTSIYLTMVGGKNNRRALVSPDSGYSWLVLAACFLNQAVAMGTTYSVGVYIVEWMESFQASPEIVSWVGAINMAAVFGLGKLTCRLII